MDLRRLVIDLDMHNLLKWPTTTLMSQKFPNSAPVKLDFAVDIGQQKACWKTACGVVSSLSTNVDLGEFLVLPYKPGRCCFETGCSICRPRRHSHGGYAAVSGTKVNQSAIIKDTPGIN